MDRWHAYRAEDQPLWRSVVHLPRYASKWVFKREGGDPDTREFFKTHRPSRASFTHEPRPTLSIALCGDLMWIRNGWAEFLGPALKQRLLKNDFGIVNLETPVSHLHPVRGRMPDYLSYNAPPELLDSFARKDGRNFFELVSLANNHALDCGTAGAEATVDFLATRGIRYSGVAFEGKTVPGPLIHERNGVRVGFLAYAWGANGFFDAGSGLSINTCKTLIGQPDEPSEAALFHKVAEMKNAGADVIILSLHWGHEFERYPAHYQRELARRLAQAGVDVIFGHHSHVIQPIEEMEVTRDGHKRSAFVLYSLGNFATAMGTRECRTGLVQEIRVDPASDGGWRVSLAESYRVYNQPYTRRQARKLILE